MSEEKHFTVNEVAKYKDDENGYYLIVHNGVYDVTKFKDEHPGGEKILRRFYGRDSTTPFRKYHNDEILKKYGERLRVGTIREVAKL